MAPRSLVLPGLAVTGALAGFFAGRLTWPGPPPAGMSSLSPPMPPALQGLAAAVRSDTTLPPFDQHHPESFFETLAASPALIAAHPVSSFPANVQRDLAFYGILVAWLQRDPGRAVTWITQQPAVWVSAFLEEFGDSVAQNSTGAAVDLTRRLNAPGKFSAFEDLLIATLPRHPQKLQEVLDSTLLSEEKRTALRLAWAKLDGAAAITSARIAGSPAEDFRQLLKAAALTAPGPALAEAERLAGEDGGAARLALLDTLATENPEIVFRHFQKNPDDPALQRSALSAWQAIIDSGGSADAEMLQFYSARLPAAAAIMGARSETDPVKAAARLSAAPAPDSGSAAMEKGSETAGHIARNYAGTDPAGALSWAQSLPNAEWRQRAVLQAATTISQSDPVVLSEWLNTAPLSEDLDGVIASLVYQIPDDPQSAWLWSERISSPAVKEQTRSWLLANWRLFDPASVPATP